MKKKGQLTVQRKTIYDIIVNSPDHPTAADVIERLKEQGCSFAYGTVYNSLRYLTDTGMVQELKLEGDAARYDARTEDHQHIVCVECGRVDEVFTEAPAAWIQAVAEETGYVIDKEQFLFKGVCAACRATGRPVN